VKTGKASYSLLPPTNGAIYEQIMEELRSAINWLKELAVSPLSMKPKVIEFTCIR
jgi:hypothetical protein